MSEIDYVAYLRQLGKRIAALERICGVYAQDNFENIANNDIATIGNAFEAWAVDTAYVIGKIVSYTDGKIYKCRTAHTSNSTWTPDVTTTYWEPIDMEHAGTYVDPIPWSNGMTANMGKYYSENEIIYRCIRDDSGTGTALYYTCAELAGDYFEIATA